MNKSFLVKKTPSFVVDLEIHSSSQKTIAMKKGNKLKKPIQFNRAGLLFLGNERRVLYSIAKKGCYFTRSFKGLIYLKKSIN
ncbi:hypothetical protein DB895_13535 [Flavobacterium psychrotolerans]|uniref:Uncharacterized protein n=1 Tax=Flavobacterium psychrotolerans TaxID=2169410 RepID=A0A2U1JG32_9FLAO|nr:hypothetical protein DB895_13535 [Flavobacterium psychrotolerans]